MSLGPLEITGIIVLALLLFGGRKLPELGSSVGKTITNFRKGLKEADEEKHEADVVPPPPAPTSTTTASTDPRDTTP